MDKVDADAGLAEVEAAAEDVEVLVALELLPLRELAEFVPVE